MGRLARRTRFHFEKQGKLYAREPGPHFNVCLRIYPYRFIHEHGSDKKLSKYEGKLQNSVNRYVLLSYAVFQSRKRLS